MIPAVDLYEDCKEQLGDDENGHFSISMFNRFSWRAQMRVLDWLTGDPAAIVPPEPYTTLKVKDFLKPFVVPLEKSIQNGVLDVPAGYYRMDNWSVLNSYTEQDCDTGETKHVYKPPTDGEILEGPAFAIRANTYIDEIKPDLIPILKIVDNKFNFLPADCGSVRIEYIRYPKKAMISSTVDPDTHDEVVVAIENFEWDEALRDLLIWWICNFFHDRNREQSGKQFNNATGKTSRG